MAQVERNEPVASSQRVEQGSVNVLPLDASDFPSSSNANTVDASKTAETIISTISDALSKKNHQALADLFLENRSYWRDHLALTWDLRTLEGREKIASFLASSKTSITKLMVDSSSAFKSPQYGPIDGWGDVKGIQFFIRFETDIGRGQGNVRLAEQNGQWKIFTMFTTLEELKGFEEPRGKRRTKGVQHGGNPDRKNWREMREAETDFKDNDPKVLIIGAGQGGLMAAARLKMLNVPALIIDSNERVGDNWRKRYHQLVLHDSVWYDHMPYLPFPDHWPVFTPKDKLAEFFESYVKLLELVAWTSTSLKSTSWNEQKKQWTVIVERKKADGSIETRTMRPNHIVQATGHAGKKNMPEINGMNNFQGDRLCHSSEFTGASPNGKGKKAVVIGCCNSGHDIAQDFYEKGYDVTMVQRSTTCVISSESITEIGMKGLYDEDGPPVEDADLFFWSLPMPILKAQQAKLTKVQNNNDQKLLDGLRKAGFELDNGPNDSGLLLKYIQRGGGYYIDVGASQLIVDGKIKVKQGQEIAEILPHSIKFADDTHLDADELVFATGYMNMRTQARLVFGDEVGDRVNNVWGLNEEGEIRTMWQKSGHPGLWFMGGNLALSRYYSRILALQIKSVEENLMG